MIELIMKNATSLLLVLILTSCGSTHPPIYDIGLELKSFDYDLVHKLAAEFSEDHGFMLHSAWDDSKRVKALKRSIERTYKRHDGLAYGFSNYDSETCLVVSFYDWHEKGLDYGSMRDMLVSYLEDHLPVAKKYPGQSRCVEPDIQEAGD